MKSYKKRRLPETSFETDGFSKQFQKEVKGQISAAGEDLWSQLFGEAANDNQARSSHDKESVKIKSLKEAIVFELFKSPANNNTRESNDNNPYKAQIVERKVASSETRREPGMRYHEDYYEGITRSGENFSRRESREIREQVKQIMAEIRKLAASTKELQVEFGQVTVAEAPVNPGKYYINFFDWLLVMLRQSRQKVEDSKAWLETVQTKSRKKQGYWEKSKKFGTSFSQSNERNVATSTG